MSIGTRSALVGLAVLGTVLAGCGKQEAAAPASAAAQEQVVPSGTVVEQAEVVMVDLPVVKMQAATAASEPALESMKIAVAESSKMGVPVDLHYEIEGDAMSGQPVTVHLAAVPRSEGTNLEVSIKEEAGLQIPKSASITAQKAEVGSAYRRQVTVTRSSEGPRELRVLVTMDFPIGKGFTYYSVPLGPKAQAGKQ